MRVLPTLQNLNSLVQCYNDYKARSRPSVNTPLRVEQVEDELGLYYGPARRPFLIGDPDRLCLYMEGRLDEAELPLHMYHVGEGDVC